MVNSSPARTSAIPLPAAQVLIRAYLLVVLGTLVALVLLADGHPQQATSEAWGHAVVVALFAVVLPRRLRRAQRGTRSAIRAVGLISAVLFCVNVVEASIPDFVPTWMRVQMVVVAALMLGSVLDVVRWAVVAKNR